MLLLPHYLGASIFALRAKIEAPNMVKYLASAGKLPAAQVARYM
jgi:hypothetical protein